MEIAGFLEEVVNSSSETDDDPPEAAPAAQRFAQGVQAALAAAESVGLPVDDHKYRLPYCFPCHPPRPRHTHSPGSSHIVYNLNSKFTVLGCNEAITSPFCRTYHSPYLQASGVSILC